MKSNFALSLSFEGIRLLHRAAGGWRLVGDVALDAADMAAELAVLRRTATALDPSGLRTKVLLPNAQIKYLTVETTGKDKDAQRNAARAALDGATPYAVDELVFDVSSDGVRTHVAAVARETLTEASEFAEEHRFNPISFAAVPDENPFVGEPFFGPAPKALAALPEGETIEPDGVAVVIVGNAAPLGAPPVPPEMVDIAAPAQTTQGFATPAGAVATDVAGPDADTAPPPVDAQAELPFVAPKTDVVTEKFATSDAATALEPAAPQANAGDVDATAPPPSPKATAPDIPGQEKDQGTPPPAAASSQARSPASDPAKDPLPQPAKTEPVNPKPATPVPVNSGPVNSGPVKSEVAKPEAPITDVSEPQADTPKLGPAQALVASRLATAVAMDRAGPANKAPKVGFTSRRSEPASPAKGAVQPRSEPPVMAPRDAGPPEIFRSTPRVTADAAAQPEKGAGRWKAAAVVAGAATAARGALAPFGRFLSRRKASAATAPQTEANRMTVFGARQSDVRGKPRFLGLLLTAALLVFLVGVAAWASVFLDDGLNLSRLFGGDRSTRAVSDTTAPEQATPTAETGTVVTASLGPTLTPEDTAVLDALRETLPAPDNALGQRELEKLYATTGIWARAPAVPPEPSGLVNINDLYLTGIDPISSASDALALPAVASFGTDLPLGSSASPAAAGTRFVLDARGLVIPTAAGAISPNGFTVYLGSPPVEPPVTLARFAAVPQDDAARTALAALRPKNRPRDLAEQNERATLNGLTRRELAGERPKLRPRSIQQEAKAAADKALAEAKAAEDAKKAAENAEETTQTETAEAQQEAPNTFASATKFATKASARPDTRPRNFARIVRRAQRTAQPAPQAEETRVASRQVAPRVVTPRNPTKKSVARNATVKNAINLRKVNLIGVYGKPSSRRALVRLSNGRYKKVTVGDRIDGGRVAAISNSELRYTKGGRSVVLRMP